MKYDREVLCVAAVLHDLGLTDVAPVQVRFEIEGADLPRSALGSTPAGSTTCRSRSASVSQASVNTNAPTTGVASCASNSSRRPGPKRPCGSTAWTINLFSGEA